MKDLVTYIRESIDDEMIDEGFFDKFKKEKDPKLLREVIEKTLVKQSSKRENLKKYMDIFKELVMKTSGAIDLEKELKGQSSIDKENASKITHDHMTYVRLYMNGSKVDFDALNEQNLVVMEVPGNTSQFKNWKQDGDLKLSNILTKNAYLIDRGAAVDLFGAFRDADFTKLKDPTITKQQLEDLKQFSQGYK